MVTREIRGVGRDRRGSPDARPVIEDEVEDPRVDGGWPAVIESPSRRVAGTRPRRSGAEIGRATPFGAWKSLIRDIHVAPTVFTPMGPRPERP
jgi:hypothetical protein